jgi:hypothetical protein
VGSLYGCFLRIDGLSRVRIKVHLSFPESLVQSHDPLKRHVDDERATLARRLEDADAALRQIFDRFDSLPFDVDEQLAQIAAAASRRQSAAARIDPDESVPTNETGLRAVPFGSGWLEWRWVEKPSGQQFGPYVYRWREGRRKRTKYVG